MKPLEPRSAADPHYATIEEVFSALESPLLGYARRLLEDVEMSEDVVQEAFLRLHLQFGEVREPRRWLYRTVHNLALNHRRRAGRTRTLPLPSARAEAVSGPGPVPEPEDPQPLPDEHIARMEGIGQVRLGLEQLDDRSRTLLLLKFRDDLSYREISGRTGLNIGHVGYLLHHAVKKLAAELTKAGVIR